MESSSSTTRFKFRDHQDMDATALSEASSDMSSVSSDRVDIHHDEDGVEDDSDLQSMTAKGIKHLCSELLELKAASDEEFQKNIFSNYPAFVRIFEEVEGIENGLMKLRNHVLNQKKLVKELVDGIYPKLLVEETIESVNEDSASDGLPPPTKLEAHINYVSEALDTLLSENRVDEALDILEMEDENFERLQFRKGSSADDLKLYSSVISEGKGVIMLKLREVAGNPRTVAAELQQALSRMCRLGGRKLVTKLLLKYYHSRVEAGVRSLQSSKSFPSCVYIRELSKFVFSMISQAARSFVMLHGETSPYFSELIQWAHKETKAFASCFTVYIRSISEISGVLLTLIQCLQFAVSFCSLLEAQKLVLRQYLIEQIHPCIQEVLEIYIDHLKKVIAIFTANDSWVLGKVSVVLIDSCTVLVGDQPEYCLLTSSGQKLVTVLQAIAQDAAPLAALGMESSIVKCLTDLFMEYTLITEEVINGETGNPDRVKDDPRVSSMETLMKQISILMNLSTLESLFSRIIRSILNCNGQEDSSNADQRNVLENSFSSIQEALGRVRSCFCWQHIVRIMSIQYDQRISSSIASSDNPSHPVLYHHVKPSIPLQVLFLELRKIRELAEDVVEIGWITELLRNMIEATFGWILDNEVMSAHHEERESAQQPNPAEEQFILDLQFLVELAKNGGYFSENLEKLRESAFLSVGLDPKRELHEHDWAITAAAEAIEKLLLLEEEELSTLEPGGTIETESEPFEPQSVQEDCLSCVEDSIGSQGCLGGGDAASTATTADASDTPGAEADFVGDFVGPGEEGHLEM